MEIINKSDEKHLAEYEQFASTRQHGNTAQSPNGSEGKRLTGAGTLLSPVTLTAISVELALS